MNQHVASLLNLREFLAQAIVKDMGPRGDVTSEAIVDRDMQIHAVLVVKATEGIVSGLRIGKTVFDIVDPTILVTLHAQDGDRISNGDIIASIEGPAQGILAGERVALEFVRRMSGIATMTRAFVQAVKGTGVTILDTRKIAPGFGELDKQAVRDGGGENHRVDLSEMGLIKNTHIDLLKGNIQEAVQRFRNVYPNIPLEVEVRNGKELRVALSSEPDRILLDNMSMRNMQQAVLLRNAHTKDIGTVILLEASGGMTLTRVRKVAKTGVEYISVGALTHSVKALDISLHIQS